MSSHPLTELPSPQSLEAEPPRPCNNCMHELPAEMFSFMDRSHTRRRNVCKRCAAAAEAARQRAHRMGLAREFFRETRGMKDRQQLDRLLNSVFRRFGGVENFVDVLFEYVMTASNSAALRAMFAIIDLIALSEKSRFNSAANLPQNGTC